MAESQTISEADLKQELASLPGWEIRDGWLRREYKTPGFSHTMLLVNTIGYLSEAAYHHPDLNVGYAQVTVKLQTHKAHAITWNDVELAKRIHEIVTWQPAESSALEGFPKNWVH